MPRCDAVSKLSVFSVSRLQLGGDEIWKIMRQMIRQNQGVQDFVDGCVEETDSVQAASTAYDQFVRIVKLVLEVDEQGRG